MTNDHELISQMIAAGKFDSLYEFIQEQNEKKLKAAIEYLGKKYCLHPCHTKKKLKKPLQDKVLFFKGKPKKEIKEEIILSLKQERFMQLFI